MQKKSTIRLIIILVITCIICFSDCSFADAISTASTDSKIGSIGWISQFLVNICQVLRIPIAKITGYFLTNKLVYGEAIGLDSLLWTYRNVVKNITNFCLGFFFIYTIFSNLIKGSIEKNLKNSLLRILIAGIGIQASRFLTAAVIDISTITLTTVGSLPSQLISSNERITESIKKELSATFSDGTRKEIQDFQTKILDLFPKDGKANSFLTVKSANISGIDNRQSLFDAIMINKNGSAGPLYFLGLSILQTNTLSSLNTSSNQSIKSSIINIIIGGGSAIIYCIEMCVLCIICILRIIYLRMFIVLSPIAILLLCISKSGQKLGDKGFIATLGKEIKLSNFILNAFQPTIIVFGISLAVLVTSLIKGVIIDNSNKTLDIGAITFSDQSSKDGEETKYNTNINSNFLSVSISNISKSLSEIILSFFTLFIIYFIIDTAIKFKKGDDFVSSKIKGLQDSAKTIMGSVPIIPVAGYSKEGIPETKYVSLKKTLDTSDSGLFQNIINDKYIKSIKDKADNEIKEIRGDTNSLTETEKLNINRAYGNANKGYNKLTAMRSAIQKSEGGKGMTLNPSAPDKYRQNKFTQRLNETSIDSVDSYNSSEENWKGIVSRWKQHDSKDEQSLKNLFQNPEFVKTYAKFFGLGKDINSRYDLQNADISNEDISNKN